MGRGEIIWQGWTQHTGKHTHIHIHSGISWLVKCEKIAGLSLEIRRDLFPVAFGGRGIMHVRPSFSPHSQMGFSLFAGMGREGGGAKDILVHKACDGAFALVCITRK